MATLQVGTTLHAAGKQLIRTDLQKLAKHANADVMQCFFYIPAKPQWSPHRTAAANMGLAAGCIGLSLTLPKIIFSHICCMQTLLNNS